MLSKQNNPMSSPILARHHLTGSKDKLKLDKEHFNSMEEIEIKENLPSSPKSHPPSPINFQTNSDTNKFISVNLPIIPTTPLPITVPQKKPISVIATPLSLATPKFVAPTNNNLFVPKSDLDYLVLASLLDREKDVPKKSNNKSSSFLPIFDKLFDDHQKKLNDKMMTSLLRARGSTGLSSHNPSANGGVKKKEKKKPKRPNKVKPQGCEWCHEKSSPVWRTGPSGRGSLCNACGLQWQKGFTIERAKDTLRKPRGEWQMERKHK